MNQRDYDLIADVIANLPLPTSFMGTEGTPVRGETLRYAVAKKFSWAFRYNENFNEEQFLGRALPGNHQS